MKKSLPQLTTTIVRSFLNCQNLKNNLAKTTAVLKQSGRILLYAGLILIAADLSAQTPGGISSSNIRLWLKADSGITNQSGVKQWNDVGGAGHNLTQVTASARPVYNSATGLANYNPTVKFDGSNDFLVSTSGLLGTSTITDIHVFSVRVLPNISSRVAFSEQCNPSRFLGHIVWGNGYTYWDAGSAYSPNREYAPWGGTVNIPYLSTLSYATSPQSQVIRGNGKILKSDANATSFKGTNQPFYLGKYFGGGYFDNAAVGEMLVVAGAMTASDINKVETYLAVKYGITLSQTTAQNYTASDGTVFWNGTANSGYKNNIAGIGRDDASKLLQKQSRSVNTAAQGNLVTMGLSTIAASNILNTGAIASDKSFMLWGDDGQTGSQTTEVPSSLINGGCMSVRRMKREWKIQETGTIGAVQIKIDLSAYANPTTILDELKLLIDNDNDFGNGGTTVVDAASYDEVTKIVTFNNVNFTNGQFFTMVLGTSSNAPGGVSSGLQFWIKADKGVFPNASGNLVSNASGCWLDQSAGEHNVDYAYSDPKLIQNAVNYNPAVEFDGNDYMRIDASAHRTFYTTFSSGDVFSVVKSYSNNQARAFPYYLGGAGFGHHYTWDNGYIYTGYGTSVRKAWNPVSLNGIEGAVRTVQGPSVDVKSFNIMNQHSATNDWRTFFNGRQQFQSLSSTVNFANHGNVHIGAYPGMGNWYGLLPEVINYSRVLSAGEKNRVNSYLAVKYGITLDQSVAQDYTASDGGTLFWKASSNTGYNKNITGIGRDDCGGLLQKQSRSINTSTEANLVAIGLDSIRTYNYNNTGKFSSDLSFLMWADDGATGVKNNEIPAAFSNPCITYTRLNKEWKVQKTNTVGVVCVRLFVGSLAQASNDVSEFKLLIDNDNDFSNGGTTIYSAGNYDPINKWVNFCGVTVADGQYFTFMVDQAPAAPGGVLTPATAQTNGVKFELYSGFDSDVTNGINGTYKTSGYIATLSNPDDAMENEIYDYFCMKLTTKLSVSITGNYQFRLNALDDNGALYVDGVLKTSLTGVHGATTMTTASISLSAGFHTIEVRYSEQAGTNTLNVEWRGVTVGLDAPTTWGSIAQNKLFLTTAPSLSAWYRSDKGVTNTGEGTNATVWKDQSPNANDLSLAVGNPTYYGSTSAQLRNFNPALAFTCDQMQSADNPNGYAFGNQDKSAFIVISKPTITAGTGWASALGRDNANNSSFGFWTTGATAQIAGASTGVGLANSFVTNNVPQLFSGTYANNTVTTSNNIRFYNNGKQTATGTYSWNVLLNDNEDFSIGTHQDYSAGCSDESIMEVIYYPWNLSAAERNRVETYLALKYGITLDQSTPANYTDGSGTTIWNGAANSTYKYNIIGIGRDDCSGLKQKQSISSNTANNARLLTIGRGMIGTANSANDSSFAADKSYLLVGDDNGSIVETNSEIPALIVAGSPCGKGKRIAREWKVQATNYAQTNQLQFDLTLLGLTSRGVTEFKLLIDNDNDFSNATTIIPATDITNNKVNFKNVTLSNGQYFTLLTTDDEITAPGGITAGLAVWHKADAGVHVDGSGNFVVSGASVWDDQSGNFRNMNTVTSDPALIAAGFNYNPVVRMDGNDYMSGTVFYNSFTSGDVFGVVKSSANNQQRAYPYYFGSSGTLGHHYTWDNGYIYNGFGTSTRKAWYPNSNTPAIAEGASASTQGPAVDVLKTHIINQHSATNNWRTFFDGRQQYQSLSSAVSFAGAQVYYGAYPGSGNWLGDEAEIILYNRVLSSGEKSKINSYLAIKYGITLDQTTASDYVASNGSAIWKASRNSIYKNNIAGIGRDICSGLHQKQSRSENTGSNGNIVAMGLGEIQSTNSTNSDTLVNLNFMFWSDDGATGFNYTDVPSSLTNGGCLQVKRLAREWRISETGAVPGVELKFYLSGIASGSSTMSDFKLLIDGDSNFSNGGTTIVPPYDYDAATRTLTFSNINFTNGQFFTLILDIGAGAPGGVVTTSQTLNGVAYNLYSGFDADLSTINGTFLQSGYTNNLTNFDDLFLNEISDNFIVSATTKLLVNTAGTYQFQLTGMDNTAALYIDGVQNLLYTTIAVTNVQGTAIALTAGYHTIEVRCSEQTGGEQFYLQWKGTTSGLDVGTTYADIADNKLFLPTAPNISAWYRADKGVEFSAEGANADKWEDQTPNGNNLTRNSSDNPLAYSTTAAQLANYNPVIVFQDDYMYANDQAQGFAIGKQGRMVFNVVSKNMTTGGTGYITSLGRDQTANSGFHTYTNGADYYLVGYSSDVSVTGQFTTLENNLPKILGAQNINYNINSVNNWQVWGNNKILASASRNNAVTLNDGPDFSVGFMTDRRIDGHDGKIIEVVEYPWNLNFTERQKVHSYFNLKYGTTFDTSYLASDGSVVWNDVSNATYKNNIAGIGMDRCGGLNQKQSRSVNPSNDGSMVAIGNYSIANSNPENTNEFIADKSFLIWGDDGTSGIKNTEIPTAVLDAEACRTFKRLNREWKVQKTGTVNEVELRFYLGNTYSNSASAITDFKLLIKNNSGDFSTGTVQAINPVSYDATTRMVSFANVLFNDNDYFTLIIDITTANPGGVVYSAGLGTVGNPYKTIFDAASNTSAGIKYFNINGTSFSTYVDASGYVLVASGLHTTDEAGYSTSTGLTLQSDKVLAPSVLSLLDINSIRMNNTGGGTALDVSTTEPRFINRLVNNQTLSQAIGDNSYWTGTGASSMAATCTPTATTLTSKIWHSCGLNTNLHWIPNDGSGGNTGDGFANGGDDADLNLWVKNTVYPLTAWFRADKGVTVATGVSSWEDQSINGKTAVQATTANQPVYNTASSLVNFNPSVTFDGASDRLTFSDAGMRPGAGKRAMIAVAVNNTGAAVYNYITSHGSYTTSNGSALGRTSTGAFGTISYGGIDHNINSVWNSPYTPKIAYGAYNGTKAEGSVDGSATSSTARSWNTLLSGTAYIGSSSSPNEFWNGQICEVIYFNDTFTAAEKQRIESYLALKYGITLDQTTPQDYLASDGATKMWNGAANAGFAKRIAGIGRDDCSGLYQKQSQSQSAISDSTVMSMAVYEFSPSNLENDNQIDSNKTFLMWGDNNGLLLEQNTELPVALNTNGNCNQGLRIGREWKVQQTKNKSVGALQVKLDISAVGIDTRDANRFRLAMNNSADFTTAVTFLEPTDFISGILTFDNVEFTDTVTYITLITDTSANIGPGGVVAGLNLWLKSDNGVYADRNGTAAGSTPAVEAGNVVSWKDNSLYKNDFYQDVTGQEPVYRVNGAGANFNPSVSFETDVADLTSNLSITSGQYTMFNVYTLDQLAPGVDRTLNGITNNWLIGPYSGEDRMFAAGWVTNPGPATPVDVARATALTHSGTAHTYYVNGKNVTTGASNIGYPGQLILGARGTYNEPHDGDVSEIIAYKRLLSAAERQRVNSYLAVKYAVGMDQTTPTNYIASDGTTKIWDAISSDNPTYKNHFIAIGKDVCSGLNQKQSQSNDTTGEYNMLAVGLGSIANTNLENGGSFTANLSFLAIGSNGLRGTKNTEYPSSVLDPNGCKSFKRLKREWKVQENGNTGALELRFNLANYISANSEIEDFKLILDSDDDFSNATTVVDATELNTAGKYVSFTGLDLTNAQYFTLVVNVSTSGPGGVSSNLVAWYRADKGVYNGSGTDVSLWSDQTVNDNNMAQTTVANRPALNASSNLLNFNPTLSFDGSNDYLDASTFRVNPTSASLLAVVKPADVNTVARDILGTGTVGSSQGAEWRLHSGKFLYGELDGGGYVEVSNNSTLVANNSYLFTSIANNSTGGISHYLTGKQDGTGTITKTPTTANFTSIGSRTHLSRAYFYSGLMPELIVYDGNLSAADKNRVESYLAIKYGLTLNQFPATDYIASNGTTKIWDATSGDNPNYRNRIIGIGKDDCSGLLQKQSTSSMATGTNQVLTFGLFAVAASNATNTGVFASNLSFLVAGDDSASMKEQVTELPAVISTQAVCSQGRRIGREWKFQASDIFAGVQVKLNIAGTNISSRTIDKFRLVLHNSSNFAGATRLMEASSWASDVLTFDNVQFDSGVTYMTLVTDTSVNIGPGGVVTEIKQWLRADQDVTIATGASNWADQSGNYRDAIQATTANQPLLTSAANNINYNPALTFNGTSQYMTFSDVGLAAGNASRTMISVASGVTDAAWRYPYFYGTNTSALGSGIAKNTANAQATVGWGNDHIVSGIWSTGASIPKIVYGDYNGTNARANVNAGTISGTAFSWNTTLTGTGYVGNNPSNERWSGRIGELIEFNTILSSGELARVNSYLAIKYGLTLNQTTPQNYVSANGTVIWTGSSAYKYNIAGIGMDYCSNLYQKQSRAQDTISAGDIVAIGLNNIANSNAENTATFAANGDFMVWGNDGIRGTKNTEYPSTLNNTACVSVKRLAREWKIQGTGTSGQNTKVRFFVNGLVTNSAVVEDFRLLIDSDDDFSNGGTTVVSANSFDATNKTVDFDNVVFPSTGYFTLVLDVYAIAPGGVNTNLATWLRGDKGVTVATGVSNWEDQGVNGWSATQATTANQPVYNTTTNLLNFNSNLSFDNSNDVLAFGRNLGLTGDVEVHLFSVINRTATGGNDVIIGPTARSTQDLEFRISSGNLGLLERNATGNVSGASTISANTSYLLSARKYTGSPGRLDIYLNGKQDGTGTLTPAWSISGDNLMIGAASTAGTTDPFNGRIGDIAVYVGSLSAINRNKIESYMALKYGITLNQTGALTSYRSSGGIIVWDSSVNSAYNSRIFGIGHDYCSGLDQKQSRSVESGGSVLTLSLDTMAASNNTNAGTFTNDTTFVILGDNNGTMTEQTSDLPSVIATCTKRLVREWKVEVTNPVETELRFDLSTATVSGTKSTDFALLVDKDGDGNFTTGTVDIYQAAAKWGSTITIPGITLNDGAVITLATQFVVPSVASDSVGYDFKEICQGDSAELTVVGGFLGNGATWKWYKGGCGKGAVIGTGTQLLVTPSVTTKYFVRAEGCNITSCDSITITVRDTSVQATSVTGTTTICAGGSTTLTATGGTLGTLASWKWYTGSCGSTLVGSGVSISVNPAVTTTYFVRAEGICSNTPCIPVTVTVRDTSVPATGIIGSDTMCLRDSVTLSFTGGDLGDNAGWKWFTGSCGGTLIDSAFSIKISPQSTTTYYLRAAGTCNTTICVSKKLVVRDTSVAATSITGTDSVCLGQSVTLAISGGTLGSQATWNWYKGGCGGTVVGTGTTLVATPSDTTTYFVNAVGYCNTTNCVSKTINTMDTSTQADSAVASVSTICKGASVTLSVSGGALGRLAKWKWYSGSCGGTLVGTGSSVSVSPSATTTYYLRPEGSCNIATCKTVTITVKDTSVPATSITGTSTICKGTSTTLSVNGGSLGTGASWKWYSGSCGGTAVGTGTSVTVSPAATTTYYLRAEGACNNTICRSLTVTVRDTSVPATSITGTSTICKGTSTTLSVSGGSLGTSASWKWYSGSCGGTSVGTGTSVSVSPAATTTYYLRAEGTCNNTICRILTVTVQDTSVPATSITGTSTICKGTSTTLSVSGGSPGTGASWKWYSGSCGSTAVGTGTSVTVSPAATTTYYLRAEGTCNNTICRSLTVTVQDTSVPATSITGTSTICKGTSTTLSVSGGSLGTSASWKWYSGSCGGTAVGTGTSVSVSPAATTTYYLRAEGTCNNTNCVSLTVNVQDTSVPATSITGTSTICKGTSTTLSVSGGSLGTGASWKWYSGSCGGTAVGTGTSVTVSPAATTTYYLRAQGTCNNTICRSLTVTVQDTSVPASSITATPGTIISAGNVKFKRVGGSLGTAATWKWYQGSCGGTLVGTGDSVTVSVTSYADTQIWLRAEGTCNTTVCVRKAIVYIPCPTDISVFGNGTLIADGKTATASADSTHFGTIDTLSSRVVRFKVKNPNCDTLKLTGTPRVQVTGTNASEFTVLNSLPSFLKAFDSTYIYIRFAPKGVGARTATVSIANNSTAKNPYNWNIEGNGRVSCDSFYAAARSYGLHTSASTYTTAGGWTCYCDNQGKLLLSLKLGGTGAVIPTNGVELKIVDTAASWYPHSIGFVGNLYGWAGLNRTWNVSPTTQPSSNVPVRFYFNNNDITAVSTVLSANSVMSVSTPTQMSFYKVINPVRPAHSAVNTLMQPDVKVQLWTGVVTDTTWALGSHSSGYYAEFAVAGFSGGGGGAGPGGLTPLPVEFTYIRATGMNNQFIRIHWGTSMEENCKYFQVERSVDGRQFVSVGNVLSKGNLTTGADYHLDDHNVIPGQLYYYRIRMVDANEGSHYTQMVAAEVGSVTDRFVVYPNPASTTLTIICTGCETGQEAGLYELFNANGALVAKGAMAEYKTMVNTGLIAEGIYTLRLTLKEQTEVHKISVVH